jgi:seryl-tRNA synthetase
VHTINATALAVPRIILAILENYWNEDKKVVEMPEKLKPWLPFE